MGFRFRKVLILFLAISAIGFGPLAIGQELIPDTIFLEGISITKAKSDFGFRSGIKALTIDSAIMNEKRALSLAELLQENTSIFVKNHGRGATATVSLRGTSASHTNVYWNGIKINSPMSGQADFSLIPLYFVDEAIVHFGQSSMSFGSGGLGGAVNLTTQPTWNKEFRANAFQSVGSYNTLSTAGFISYGGNHLKGQTRVFWEESENNFSYQNVSKKDKPLEIQKNADFSRFGILQELYYRPSHKSILSAKVWALEIDRGIPQLMSNYSTNEKNRETNKNLNAIVEWWTSSERLSWRASSAISQSSIGFSFIKNSFEGNELPVYTGNSSSVSLYNRGGFEFQLNRWIKAETVAEFNAHWVKSAEQVMGTNMDVKQWQSAIRTTINTNPFERLFIFLLVAEEVYDGKPMPVSSSIALEYRFLKQKNLGAKGGVSRNYHHPSLNDMYWQPGGNPNLKAEDGTSWEAGLNFEIPQTKLKNSFEVNVFRSEISNWILWLPNLKGYWEPVNLSKVNARGVELAMFVNQEVGSIRLGISGRYSYTKSTIENSGGVMRPEANGKQLPFIPFHSGGLSVNSSWKKFSIIYTFTHFSERFTTTSNNPNSVRRLYPYYMNSASIGKDFNLLKTNAALQLRVDNLLNESYQTILWRPMPGRNYIFTIKVDL